MKKISLPLVLLWRCKRDPDKEKTEEEKESGERGSKQKKRFLSGFGNSDSWGPFVLITAEQRVRRY